MEVIQAVENDGNRVYKKWSMLQIILTNSKKQKQKNCYKTISELDFVHNIINKVYIILEK